MPAPMVFISYSHDSPQHKEWVLQLAITLRAHGIDVTLDQWDLVAGQDMAAFMTTGIRTADRVVLICSEAYVSKAEGGIGGVGYERLIVTGEVIGAIDTIKFIPVIRNNPGTRKVPDFLGPRKYVDFTEDGQYAARLEELAREIQGAPATVKPKLGENPFKAEVIAPAEPVRAASPSGTTDAGVPILSGDWFKSQHDAAAYGIGMLHQGPDGSMQRFTALGAMELRFGLYSGLNKTQIELLNAVRASEIKTFGWPIGVLLENRDEYKPRPFGDGIRAEISIADDGDTSYDYWAVRKSGDFYLLQSFFEDKRAKNALFFNTRIVRVTESLLFASRLYTTLGVAPDAKVSVRFTHTGLAGRMLKSASGNRYLSTQSTSLEEVSETETVIVLGDIHTALVDEVRRVCEPMFMLFDFQELAPQVYEDIVRRFEAGEAT
ncbi:MAG: toll/interleukin-1 receptor domain-containing protein [Glaciimonas sp.]|nr:toll/interleukin-1 receptor domain-containing protein [Glaciimonas sp.]